MIGRDPLTGFTIDIDGGDIQLGCPACGTVFEMPSGVYLLQVIRAADIHADSDDHVIALLAKGSQQ